MKLSPTEIFKGKKIFFIGGTGFVGNNRATVRMSFKPIEFERFRNEAGGEVD